MQMKDLMWEMFRSTGHVGAYLLFKQFEQENEISTFDDMEEEFFQQQMPVS